MLVASGLGVLWLMMLTGVGVPLGVPPLPDDPMLARIAPEECLLYFSSAGVARPDIKSANQTEKLFAEPEVQRMAAGIEKLIRTQLQQAANRQNPAAMVLTEQAPTLVKALLTRPLAVYVADVKFVPGALPEIRTGARQTVGNITVHEASGHGAPPEIRAGAVVNLGEDANNVKAALEHCLAVLVPGKAEDIMLAGTTFHKIGSRPGHPELTWGVKEHYLFFATGSGELEALLQRSHGSAPAWLTALRRDLAVERTSTVGMLNARALIDGLAPLGGPDLPRILDAIGLGCVDRVAGVSGLDKEGFVSRSLVSFHGEPRGLLRLADQKPLTTADLDLIPRDATFALAWKLDPEKARATVLDFVDVAEKIKPNAKEERKPKLTEAQRDFLEEVVKALGDSWCVFDSPGGGGMFAGVTAVASLKDSQAAARAQEKFLRLAASAFEGVPNARHRPRIQHFNFAHKTIYVFEAQEKGFPLAPAWCLTDKHLIVAAYPEAIKAFLSRGHSFRPLTSVPEVATALGGEGQAIKLFYTDTPRIFDLVYPLLPVIFHNVATELRLDGIDVPPDLLPSAASIRRHLRPSVATVRRTPAGLEMVSRGTIPGTSAFGTGAVAAGLMVPAVQKVREASGRMQSSNNLKQIAVAMHNYSFTYGSFPPAYRAAKDERRLLSWRVLILPYIGQETLYGEFHLDEPWDSPHNKKLIERMPMTYRSPASAAGPGMTNYLTVRGPNTAFPGDKGVKIAEITDGTSNTIAVVEVPDARAVVWTRPDDFVFDERNALSGLLGLRPGGFLAAFCDGSVRFVSGTVDPKALRNAFIRNDGNPVPLDGPGR